MSVEVPSHAVYHDITACHQVWHLMRSFIMHDKVDIHRSNIKVIGLMLCAGEPGQTVGWTNGQMLPNILFPCYVVDKM